ncbi:Topoisomerase 1-associated factor 1 [Mortierella antarctica]|nr:Topoisomerase 1-associated factor 1 [Mortierella antarctica]
MDPDTESLLVSTCHALGGFEDRSERMDDASQVYVMGDECLECLKDIKKFIKYYDEPGDNVVLNFLGKMGVLEKDLIPIMLLNTPADNSTKERLVLACIELMVPMTWIIDIKALQEIATMEEDSSIVGNLYAKTEILRKYKKAFLQPGVLGAVFAILLKPLEVEHRMRTTRDQAVIRLGLSLFRNLVAIPDTESSITGTMEQFISSIMQEELLRRYQDENIMALLVTLASSASDPQLAEWNSLTLEVFYYIFSGIEPDDLIPTVNGSVKNSQLQDMLNKEQQAKANQSTAGRKRHDRFGTTGEVRLKDGTRMVLHKNGALFTPFENQLDEIKKPRAKTKRQIEFGEYKKNLSKSGALMLRNLAMNMLDSCFNPLFGSLRKDMESRRERVKDHHHGQYLYLMGFLLKYQRQYSDYLGKQYHERKRKMTDRQLQALKQEYKENMKQCNFGLVGTAVQVKSVFQVVQMMREKSELKEWEMVRRAMDCFQEILMTLHAMFKSSDEAYKDASNSVQNNLYYEGATLELFLDLARNYKTQSKKYLHTLTRMIHILLKTLENYSKSTDYMYVRKKRTIAKKKAEKAATEAQGDGAQNAEAQANEDLPQVDQLDLGDEGERNGQERDQDEEEAEENEQTHTMTEHKFLFSEYERRFATENIVQTYCTFLEDYKELNETELHWTSSMFHRIAVNCANLAVFYKLSTLQLFHQILQDNKEPTRRDLVPTTNYIVHQFFKKLQEYPPLIVEVMFPKTSKSCLTINVGPEVAEQKAEAAAAKKEKQLENTEMQIDDTIPLSDQIRIAVMALVDEEHEDLVDWVHGLLKDAIAKRTLMAFRSETELAANPDLMESIGDVEDIPVVPTTPVQTRALRVEPRFRLLLKLTGFVREEQDGAKYKIPRDLPTDTISEFADLIKAELDKGPIEHAEYNFAELIKTMKKKASSSRKKSSGVNGQTHEPKEAPVYHSTEYVLDSDEEVDEDYLRAETDLRKRHKAELEEAEMQHREQEEANARAKSHRAKEQILQRMRERRKAARGQPEAVGGEEPEEEADQPGDKDNGDDQEEDLGRAAKNTSDVESDMDSDSDRDADRDRAAKSTSDVDSDDSDLGIFSRKPSSMSRFEHGGSGEPSISQGTPTRKRQIIWDDSEDEDMAGSDVESGTAAGLGSGGPPPHKKIAFEE